MSLFVILLGNCDDDDFFRISVRSIDATGYDIFETDTTRRDRRVGKKQIEII